MGYEKPIPKLAIPSIALLIILCLPAAYADTRDDDCDERYLQTEMLDECSDGTPITECSANRPQYCTESRQLINNCISCGCFLSQLCQADGSCMQLSEGGCNPDGTHSEDGKCSYICGADPECDYINHLPNNYKLFGNHCDENCKYHTEFDRWQISTDIVVRPGDIKTVDFLAVDVYGYEADYGQPVLRNGPFTVLDGPTKISRGHYQVTVEYFDGQEWEDFRQERGDFYLWKAYQEKSSMWTTKISEDAQPVWHGIFHVHTHDHSTIPLIVGINETLSRMSRLFKFAATSDHAFDPFLNTEQFQERVDVTNEWYEPGEFVTFPGFEFSGGTGGANMYFVGDSYYMPRDPDCKVPCFADTMDQVVGEDNYLIICHPQNNLRFIDDVRQEAGSEEGIHGAWLYPEVEGFEYYSMWNVRKQKEEGETEFNRWHYLDIFREGIEMGRRFFVTGDSDTHHGVWRNGYVPATDWYNVDRSPHNGSHAYTFVIADELTRESIWGSLKSKQTYAATIGCYMNLTITRDGIPVGRESYLDGDSGYKISFEINHGPSLTRDGYSDDARVSFYRWDNSSGEILLLHEADYERNYTAELDIYPEAGDAYWVEGEVGLYDSYLSTPYWLMAPDTCPDRTLYGECSSTKPKYCDQGILVDDCQTCGCPTSMECQTDSSCTSHTPNEGDVTGPGTGGERDNVVDIYDLTAVGTNLGHTGSSIIPPEADITGDGSVDVYDLVAVGRNFGNVY